LTRYAYFDHEADMGIVGYGKTQEAAMESAAEATFALMADLEEIKPTRAVEVNFDEPDPEFALVIWLNRLLAEARARGPGARAIHARTHGRSLVWHRLGRAMARRSGARR
jgi:SHS2 domain-containing protein